MHMADALLSPAVGATLWGVSGLTLAWSSHRVRQSTQDQLTPLMGVLGAFIFAAQMINFALPGTGSSGHIGGGLLLAILLGPHAAFVVLASILTVQALFFADGGLLALGANIFNMGIFSCFIGYLGIYRPLTQNEQLSTKRIGIATVLASIVSLQLGAFFVVLETRVSGISSLPLGAFLLMMQPIHLAIGIVEGLATAAVLLFVRKHRPDLLTWSKADLSSALKPSTSASTLKPLWIFFGVAAALIGGLFSSFASALPDGLEWSIERVTGNAELHPPDSSFHATLAQVQKSVAVLPEYDFPSAENQRDGSDAQHEQAQGVGTINDAKPVVAPGTSLSGIVGGAATLGLTMLVGYLLKRRRVP